MLVFEVLVRRRCELLLPVIESPSLLVNPSKFLANHYDGVLWQFKVVRLFVGIQGRKVSVVLKVRKETRPGRDLSTRRMSPLTKALSGVGLTFSEGRQWSGQQQMNI